jgi:hypothetical protein
MKESQDIITTRKKDYTLVVKTLSAIADDVSLILFNSIADASLSSRDFLRAKLNISERQYYSRISQLIKSGLVVRSNRRFFLTSFGKIVYDAQKRIQNATEDQWKLKVIDSIEKSAHNELPVEECTRIIDCLIKDYQIRDILFQYPMMNPVSVKNNRYEKSHTKLAIPPI